MFLSVLLRPEGTSTSRMQKENRISTSLVPVFEEVLYRGKIPVSRSSRIQPVNQRRIRFEDSALHDHYAIPRSIQGSLDPFHPFHKEISVKWEMQAVSVRIEGMKI
ncbi:hypothetical protein TNCV_4536521 [Trichonephila clavipes]|nr:hypothetical protein TNCV_4536521 [Trichonephila clavipes]